MMRAEALQEARRLRKVELRIAGLDANKKAVRRGMREAMHVEDRMVRLRQLVQGEHAKHRGERRAEDGKLKSDGNESRPAIERAATDVHGISNRGSPVLKAKTAQPAGQAAQQRNGGH